MKGIKATMIIALFFALTGIILAMGKHNEEDVLADSLKTLQGLDTTRLEKYKAEVIIDAKWGSGPREFGVIKEAAGIAPNCYTVDDEGKIYISDPVNARLQIFEPNGNYLREFRYTEKDSRSRYLGWRIYDIAIDKNKNIYILFYINIGFFPGQSVEVRKYNSTGEFIDSFPIPLELLGPTTEEIEMSMPSLLIREKITRIVIENDDVKVEGLFESEYLGKEKGERRRYTLIKNKRVLHKNGILETKEVIAAKEEKIKFSHLGYLGYYFGHFDSTDNYFYFIDQEKVGEKNGWGVYQGIIYKYDKNGRLSAIMKHPFYKWGDPKQLYYDDKTQNIYCLTNDDAGVKLLVFENH